jgi:hypothetical protein
MERLIKYLAALVFSLILVSASGQENRVQKLENLFARNNEVYFTFEIFSRDEIPALTRIISIDNVRGNTVTAYANKNEFSHFLDLGYNYILLQDPGTLLPESELNMGGKLNRPQNGTLWNFYPTYDQYVAYMVAFAANNPAICRLDTLGTSVQGRLLLAVKLSDSVNVKRGKPEFLYTSTIHGDELVGYIDMLHLIDSLVSGYGTIPRITNLLNNFQIYINPLANPDGTYYGGNGTVNGAQRYNANGVDLNRNFPDPQGGPHPDGYQWQPETRAFMHYDTIHHFVMSANYHSGSEVVNYPWDTWAKLHADDTWMQFVAREFADTIHQYSPNGYFTDLNNGITNGYAWYQVVGGRQDYTTYFHYGREMTIELSYTKILPANLLLTYWGYNKRSFLNYIEESNYGINGQVTDTATGQPLKAKIFITGHDIDDSWEYSDSTSGWYYRPIAQGNWALTFSRSGYYSKTIHNINVVNRNTTPLNVKLVPIGYGVPELSQNNFSFLYPNPSDGNIRILVPEVGTLFTYSVFDVTGRQIRSGLLDGRGNNATQSFDFSSFPKGIYLFRLDGGKTIYENKMVIR